MNVRVLGSAAGGGIPQWNCDCSGCTAARRSGIHRTQDTVAVSGDGSAWYLLNASPDLRVQLLSSFAFGRRDNPIRGVLLTTAELDHVTGLLTLREDPGLRIFATAAVRRAVTTLLPLVDFRWGGFPGGLEGGLPVRSMVVGRKVPRYARPGPFDDWVSALRFGDRFVYATCLPEWTDEFDAFVAGAEVALLDGTFATADEPGLPRTPREMGHLPVADYLPKLRRHPGTRFLLGHLNNTNPLAVPGADSPVEVATDGLTLDW